MIHAQHAAYASCKGACAAAKLAHSRPCTAACRTCTTRLAQQQHSPLERPMPAPQRPCTVYCLQAIRAMLAP